MSEKISEPGSRPGSAEDDLARRFFALWAEYLAALVTDPKMTEQLGRWLAFAAGALQNPAPGNASPGSAGGSAPGSTIDAATAAGASGERDGAVAELARRVDELARRVAAIERPGEHGGEHPGERGTRPAGGARRGNRASRS
jgi:hypothetical protein